MYHCAIYIIYIYIYLRPLQERSQFYDDLEENISIFPPSTDKFTLGDFNARIGQRRLGEEGFLGDYCFGREAQHKVEIPNRGLLVELCCSYEAHIANTYFDNPSFKQVTCRST